MFAKPEREKFCRIQLPIGDFVMARSCGILYTNAMVTNKILVGDYVFHYVWNTKSDHIQIVVLPRHLVTVSVGKK